MSIDFGGLLTTDNYSTAFVPKANASTTALAQMLDPVYAVYVGTPPTGAKRLNAGVMESFNGTAWVGQSVNGINYLAGSIGLGVTPSTWTNSGGAGLELGASGSGIFGNASVVDVLLNATYSSGWKYSSAAAAAYFSLSPGQHTWYVAPVGTVGGAITWTQAMALNSGGSLSVLGVVTAAGFTGPLTGHASLDLPLTGGTIASGAGANTLALDSTATSGGYAAFTQAGTIYGYIGNAGALTTGGVLNQLGIRFENALSISRGGVEALHIDNAGKVGIGVIPSAWTGGFVPLQIASSGLAGFDNGAGNIQTELETNACQSSLGTYTYIKAGAAVQYRQLTSTGHTWATAPGGAAGAVIPWTTSMTLDGNSKLTVTGTASALGNELGYRSTPLTTYTSASTLAIADRGKAHNKTDGTQVTVPASVFAAGDTVVIYNWSTTNMTIVSGAGLTMYKGGSATTGNRTLLGVGAATVLFQTATACVIQGPLL